MPYTREMFEQAQQIIAARKAEAEEKAEAKRRLFETLEPEYKKWKNECILSVKEALKSIDLEPEKAQTLLEEQKKRNFRAQQEIALLLKKNGLPADYLEIKWTCGVCEDTGVVNGRLCDCHIDLLKKLAFEEAGRKSPLKFSRFSDFDLSYYDDAYKPEYKCSARERMETVFRFCKDYAADFDLSSPNILMCGETGLGKTHLSLAIAGEVIEKGYHVLYNSAQNIFNELQKERFGKTDTNGQYEAMVLECDLLVVDDLGVEFSTPFTNAALYNIINTRLNTSLPTIISTNLNLKELEERYTRRVSSRLIGDYAALLFFGSDIRQKKNG
ncbi:MAG: ATP-binding protein [Clostridia bacterium]|nr:ATP-binding protein [Clostridia bacterium]